MARTLRALCSATYSASVNFAKLSLMAVSCRPRPSAASRLSSGMVYPCRTKACADGDIGQPHSVHPSLAFDKSDAVMF